VAADKGVFARLTPPGEGGIAAFAVEGPGARAALAAAVSSARIAGLAPGELAYGRLLGSSGNVLDEVIVAALPARAGAERFELNCHAGGAAAAAAAERLVELGLVRLDAAPPGPGLSLLERDFRAALGRVRTRRQLAALCAARRELPGELGRAIEMLAPSAGEQRWAAAAGVLDGVVEETRRLRALLSTHRVVLAGPANAGKSTLFNALLGRDRAITGPHPGTTRDAVEAEMALGGLAVRLTDTAGLGGGAAALGELADRAQQGSRREAAGAGLLLLVVDGARPPGEEERSEVRALAGAACGRLLAVLGKGDLPLDDGARRLASEISGGNALRTSALTGAGMEELLGAIERALLPAPPAGRAAAFGRELPASMERASTCARRAAVENAPEAAGEAARFLGAVLETGPCPGPASTC